MVGISLAQSRQIGCADRGHSSWACRSRQPSTRCGSDRVSARTHLQTKMPWRSSLPNASELRLHFQPRCRHRLWQLFGLVFGTLARPVTASGVWRKGCRPPHSCLSNLGATATCFDYTKRIVTRPEILWSVGARLRQQASTFKIHPGPVRSQESLQPGPGLEGQGEAAGSDRPRGGTNSP